MAGGRQAEAEPDIGLDVIATLGWLAVALHVFGLTGGIGSGKSTVAAQFRARGLPVVDADDLARQVVDAGTPGLAAIVEAFGAEMLTPEGQLDRSKLAGSGL